MPMIIPDAYRFVIPLLAAAGVSFWLGWVAVSLFLVVLSSFTCYFFRNPPRKIPEGENLIVSPADGKVVKIWSASETEDGRQGLSIFLSVLDVHVNRSPIGGQLESLEYKRGRFKAAFNEEASRVNEQNILTIRGNSAHIVVKQIAGLIARRVVCWKQPGNPMRRGELIGLIRFGSRVDVLMPANVRILVSVGDRVKGGTSVLARIP